VTLVVFVSMQSIVHFTALCLDIYSFLKYFWVFGFSGAHFKFLVKCLNLLDFACMIC
jgi:hypothetical protein